MHVYSQLQDDQDAPVYVFLEGFGGGSSYYNYKMLWEPLSDKASIVTIDYLGYGMSDSTNADRTVDNIVTETSDALTTAGFHS